MRQLHLRPELRERTILLPQMASPKKPALPWAVADAAAKPEAQPQALVDAAEAEEPQEDQPWLPLEAVELTAGAELEARWQLFREDEQGQEQRSSKWWPGKVVGTKAAPEGSVPDAANPPGPSYELVYEPDEENGFSAECVVVAFLDKHTMLDLTAKAAGAQEGATGQLAWRSKGDAWEPPPSEDGEEEEEGLAEEAEDGEEEEGDGADLVLDARNELVMAEGVSAILGGFKDMVAKKKEEGDGSVDISVADVHALFASLNEKRQRLQ